MMCPLDENGETSCPVLTDPDIPWYFNGNYIVILVVLIVVVPLASLKVSLYTVDWLKLDFPEYRIPRLHIWLLDWLHGFLHNYYRHQILSRYGEVSTLRGQCCKRHDAF